jgi:hypothetical protein
MVEGRLHMTENPKSHTPVADVDKAPVSDETLRRWTKVIVRTALAELRATHLDSKPDVHSPDRAILTPEGCQALLQIGEKALRALRNRRKDPIPHLETSNSCRFHRAEVLLWFAEQSKKPKEPAPG